MVSPVLWSAACDEAAQTPASVAAAAAAPAKSRRAQVSTSSGAGSATADLGVLFLLGGILLAGCGQDEAASPQAAPPPPAVTVASVAAADVRPKSEFVGRVEAINKVDLRARVTGFLEKRLFEEGQEVKAGDLLFVIEQPPYQAAVDQRQAELASAEAKKANTAAQLKRGEELVKNNDIARSEVDIRRADDQMAAASIEGAQAELEQAQINYGYTEIRAPIDGKIGRAAYTVGNRVGPDSGVLATIVSREPMYVTFPVSAAVIVQTQREAGGELPDPSKFVVRIKLPDGSLYQHPGKIDFLSNQVAQGTDTLTARAVFPNPERLLVDGQFVTVTVETGEPVTALVVPQGAVQVDQAGPYVLMVGADQKVEQRRVTLGADQGADVVVQSGLKPGERIIVSGIQKVRPGMQVAASEGQPTPGEGEPPSPGGARPAAPSAQ
jgi:membrane fusion protein (multidrug efflux system)